MLICSRSNGRALLNMNCAFRVIATSVLLLVCSPVSAEDGFPVAHHRMWSVFCEEFCWILTPSGRGDDVFLISSIQSDGSIQTSIQLLSGVFSTTERFSLSVGDFSVTLAAVNSGGYIPDQEAEITVVGEFIRGHAVEVETDRDVYKFSLIGYTAALADAFERSGFEFNKNSF